MDFFFKCGSSAKLGDNKRSVINTFSSHKYGVLKSLTCYGNNVIQCNDTLIHKWRLKINESRFSVCVGIDRADCKWINECFYEMDEGWKKDSPISYSYYTNSEKYGYKCSAGDMEKYGCSYGTGDTVEITLDLAARSISFAVNNMDQGVAFKNIAKQNYRLAVYIDGWHDLISILKYGKRENVKVYVQSIIDEIKEENKEIELSKKDEINEENKNDEIRCLEQDTINQQRTSDLQKQIEKYKQTTESSSKHIEQLKNENMRQQKLINDLQRQIEQNKETSNENNRLRQNLDKNQRKIQSLNEKANKLEDEQKEILMENNDLKREIKELKIECMDESKYKTWTSQEIVAWILSLDYNRYAKYEQILTASLTEEGVLGEHLCDVDAGDIRGWGIKDFLDKKKLSKKITELVNKYEDNENEQNLNEGTNTEYI